MRVHMYLTIIMCSCSTDMLNHLKNWQTVANERRRGRYSIILMSQAHELSDRLGVLFLMGEPLFFAIVCCGLSLKFYAKNSDNLIAHLTLHLNGGSFIFRKSVQTFFLHVGSFIITLTPIRTRSIWNKPHYLIALEGIEINVEPVLVPH